jgi:hypothetical protein
MRGIDRCDWWQQEALKRNQDEFDMHIYNDFTGYGMHELMENIVSRPQDFELIQVSLLVKVCAVWLSLQADRQLPRYLA